MSGGGGESHFKSKDFALRAQKKIFGQLANRKTVKALIDESLSSVLDLMYQLLKCHTRDKKIAEKFVKNIIKLSIKVGLLVQNEKFSTDELKLANKFAEKFRAIAMTITSFIEVDYSYDQKFLLASITQCEEILVSLVKSHLTEKSVNRIRSVTSQLKDTKLLDNSFRRGTQEYEIVTKIVTEINKAVENGDL